MTEEETVERLRQWWAEYGRLVLGGLVLGLGVLFGGQAWQNNREKQLLDASDLYEQTVSAMLAGDLETVRALTDLLAEDYPSSPYDTHAMLALAKVQVDQGALEDAAATLARAIESGPEDALAPMLRIRQARVLLALDRPQEALDVLGVRAPPRYAALHYEVVGDALLDLGRPEEARTAYRDAREGVSTPGERDLIEFKLAALGPSPDETTVTLDDPASAETAEDPSGDASDAEDTADAPAGSADGEAGETEGAAETDAGDAGADEPDAGA